MTSRLKRWIREWLTEHFDFVPREDHELRLTTVAHLAKHCVELERRNKALAEALDDRRFWEYETTSF